jgi:hypothetical protein
MKEITYSEAVQHAKSLIQAFLTSELKTPLSEFHYTTTGAAMLRHDTARLLAWAEASAGGFDVLRLGMAYSLEQGEELPPAALTWLVRHLRGELTRPKARAGAKTEVWLHMQIWTSVSWLVAVYGMKATRNDTSEPTSACDAVADALGELGLQPTTFFGVKRIWLRFERNKGTALDAT